MASEGPYDIDHRWVHIQYKEDASFVETYGFSGSQGAVNLEGLLMTPKGVRSSTLLIFMHPASTLLPVPQATVRPDGMCCVRQAAMPGTTPH
jgi:hypothetical protein